MIKILRPTKVGETLRDPATGRNLPPEGKGVSMKGQSGTFWRRRLADGSVTEVAPSTSIDIINPQESEGA